MALSSALLKSITKYLGALFLSITTEPSSSTNLEIKEERRVGKEII